MWHQYVGNIFSLCESGASWQIIFFLKDKVLAKFHWVKFKLVDCVVELFHDLCPCFLFLCLNRYCIWEQFPEFQCNYCYHSCITKQSLTSTCFTSCSTDPNIQLMLRTRPPKKNLKLELKERITPACEPTCHCSSLLPAGWLRAGLWWGPTWKPTYRTSLTPPSSIS